LSKLLPYILFEKYIYIFRVENVLVFFDTLSFLFLCFFKFLVFEAAIYANKDVYKRPASPWNQHCVDCIGTLSFPVRSTRTALN